MPAGTIADTIDFLHKACLSPSTSTFIKAIENGHFSTWPMLTSENVKKYLPKSEAMAMDHLDQHRKNTQSTKSHQTQAAISAINHDPSCHTATPTRTHQVYADLLDINRPTGQIFSDQTGQFPVQSSRGNKYVMII
jgi:hypothetical protein